MILGIAGLGYLTTNFDPQETKVFVFPAVYLSVFLSVYGLFSLLGYGVRAWRATGPNRNLVAAAASRQGFLLGLLSVSSLMLLAGGLFNWWSGILLFVIFIFLELYAR